MDFAYYLLYKGLTFLFISDITKTYSILSSFAKYKKSLAVTM